MRIFQQSMVQRSEKKLSEMKHYCEKLIANLQEENKILKTQLGNANADFVTLKKKYEEVSNCAGVSNLCFRTQLDLILFFEFYYTIRTT